MSETIDPRAALTPRLAIPYPLPSDALTDYPTTGRTLAERLEALIDPPILANFPANPYDGQTVRIVVNSPSPAVWTFRYSASSTWAQKWDFIAGAPYFASDFTQYGLAVSQSLNYNPSVYVPLNGIYIIRLWSACGNAANTGAFGGTVIITPHFVGGVAPGTVGGGAAFQDVGFSAIATPHCELLGALTVDQIIQVGLFTNHAIATNERYISLTPLRCGPASLTAEELEHDRQLLERSRGWPAAEPA